MTETNSNWPVCPECGTAMDWKGLSAVTGQPTVDMWKCAVDGITLTTTQPEGKAW